MEKSKCILEVDRISDLPDPLLLHILSFLPVNEAVATSLLSKRWRPLWLSLPTLYLSAGEYTYRQERCTPVFDQFEFGDNFYQFVDKILELVDLKSVKKLVLECDNSRPRKISEWIEVVIKNEVEHLELKSLPKPNHYKFPSGVFTAKHIKVLKLSKVKVKTLSHANLPLLEVLHLKFVKFSEFRSLEMLLSACPSLKDLVLDFCSDDFSSKLNVGGLNHLVAANVPQSLIPLKVLSNVTFLHLRRVSYVEQEMWPSSGDIPTFHNLIHLECVADEWTKMLNCLQSFPKLQKLVIEKLLSSSPPERILGVPPCVSLHLKEFTLCSFRGSECEIEMVKFIMKNARVLRTVYVCEDSIVYKIPSFQKLASSCLSSNSECCKPFVFTIPRCYY